MAEIHHPLTPPAVGEISICTLFGKKNYEKTFENDFDTV